VWQLTKKIKNENKNKSDKRKLQSKLNSMAKAHKVAFWL